MKEANATKLAAQLQQDMPAATIMAREDLRNPEGGTNVWRVDVHDRALGHDYGDSYRIYGPDELEALYEQFPHLKVERDLFDAVRKFGRKLVTGEKPVARPLSEAVQNILEALEDVYRHDCAGWAEKPECSGRVLGDEPLCESCRWSKQTFEAKSIGMDCCNCYRTITYHKTEAAGHPVLCDHCREAGTPMPEKWAAILRDKGEVDYDRAYDVACTTAGGVAFVPAGPESVRDPDTAAEIKDGAA